MRAQLEKKVAQREKEKQEDKLRKLAQKAREARAGIQNTSEKSHDEKERDQLRYERHKDREKERRIAKAAPDKRYCYYDLSSAHGCNQQSVFCCPPCYRNRLCSLKNTTLL